MSKKVKTIIVGAIVIALLVGVLVVLQLTKAPPVDPADTVSYAEDEFITLIKESQSDLESIHIKNPKDDYIINKQAEERWGVESIMDLPQTYYLYTETVPMACNVVATNIIEENCKDLSKFGLKIPELVFEVNFKNGNKYSISVGAISSDKKVQYACETGKNTVYAFSSTTFKNFYYDRYDYVDKIVIPGFDSDKPAEIPIINEMSVSRPDLEKPIALKQIEKNTQSENAVTQAYLHMTSPINSMISETPAQTYVYGNFGLTAESVASAKPTEAELEEYGFSNPTSEFMIRYNDTSKVTVKTGKGIECKHEIDEDLKNHTHSIVSYYAMREGGSQVYLIKADDIIWMDFQPKDIISSIAVLPHILDIDNVDVTLDGKAHNIKYIKGADPKDVSKLTATLDGKAIDITGAKSFLNLCQLTSIQDINTVAPTGKPTASIKYNYTNGKSDLVEVFIAEDRKCVLSVNGNNAFIGRPGYTDKLIKELGNLQNGKEIDIDW